MPQGIHQHPPEPEPELHPDVFVRCVLGLAVVVVIELAGIWLLLFERLT